MKLKATLHRDPAQSALFPEFSSTQALHQSTHLIAKEVPLMRIYSAPLAAHSTPCLVPSLDLTAHLRFISFIPPIFHLIEPFCSSVALP